MISVIIEDRDGNRGFVQYNAGDVDISFPDKEKARKIKSCLTKKQEFKIPESQRIDDYRVDVVSPTENEDYFLMALSGLAGCSGVVVDWENSKLY